MLKRKFKVLILLRSAPDGQCEVHGGKHGKAGGDDHGHKDVGEECQMLIIKQTEGPMNTFDAVLFKFNMQDIPDDEGEESRDT